MLFRSAAKDLADIVTGNTQNNQSIDSGFVTEAEYQTAIEQALALTNCTISGIIKYTNSDQAEPWLSLDYTYKMATDKKYIGGTDANGTYEYYYSKEEGVDYTYQKVDGEWAKTVSTKEIDYSNAKFAEILTPFKTVYSSLILNKDTLFFEGENVLLENEAQATQESQESDETQEAPQITLKSLKLKFNDKKLVFVEFSTEILTDVENVTCTLYYSLSFSNQGTTNVELPF